MNRNHVIGLSRQNPCGNCFANSAAIKLQFNLINESFATLLFLFVIWQRQAELLCSVRTDERDILPGKFRQGLWQFLQPAVVCEATIVDSWIGAENQFEGVGFKGLGVG